MLIFCWSAAAAQAVPMTLVLAQAVVVAAVAAVSSQVRASLVKAPTRLRSVLVAHRQQLKDRAITVPHHRLFVPQTVAVLAVLGVAVLVVLVAAQDKSMPIMAVQAFQAKVMLVEMEILVERMVLAAVAVLVRLVVTQQ
jgi:hypothetical protein